MATATRDETHIPMDLRIGVTGHRNVGADGLSIAALRQRVRAVFAFLWQTAVDAAPRGSTPQLIVVSPLAEGADRFVANEAIASGFPLHCPLPFPPDEYEQDFHTEASRREFRTLLAQAAVVRALSGVRGPGHEGEAYAAVGRVVIQESDLLIAIWDGEAARGSGGTAHVITDALSDALPVIWIASDPPHDICVLTMRAGEQHSSPLALLAQYVRDRLHARR
jgi:hypothetical protein